MAMGVAVCLVSWVVVQYRTVSDVVYEFVWTEGSEEKRWAECCDSTITTRGAYNHDADTGKDDEDSEPIYLP